MSRRKTKEKKEEKNDKITTDSWAPINYEPTEPESPTPEATQEVGVNMCYCTKCDRFRGMKGFTLDRHGMLMIKLQCGHTEYFAFKVELSGKKAEEQFGK